ncbi:MAG TPA: hypothetical protein VFB58_04755 [Chloroflexota bacterium]|nr:hypothetical protein [Chloroflexota bacterium]
MRQPNTGLEVLLAIVMLVLAPVWISVSVLAGVVFYRRYRQHKGR